MCSFFRSTSGSKPSHRWFPGPEVTIVFSADDSLVAIGNSRSAGFRVSILSHNLLREELKGVLVDHQVFRTRDSSFCCNVRVTAEEAEDIDSPETNVFFVGSDLLMSIGGTIFRWTNLGSPSPTRSLFLDMAAYDTDSSTHWWGIQKVALGSSDGRLDLAVQYAKSGRLGPHVQFRIWHLRSYQDTPSPDNEEQWISPRMKDFGVVDWSQGLLITRSLRSSVIAVLDLERHVEALYNLPRGVRAIPHIVTEFVAHNGRFSVIRKCTSWHRSLAGDSRTRLG